MHARRTGGFAGATGQAAIKMQLCFRRGRFALEHLLDQVNPSARTVKFVTEQLIGRAGRRAKTAMHASAQNGFSFLAGAGIANEIGEMSFHERVRFPD